MELSKLNTAHLAVCPAAVEGAAGAGGTASLRHLLLDESGQDLIEYALVAALVGLGALAAMRGLKNSIGTSFNSVGNQLTNSV